MPVTVINAISRSLWEPIHADHKHDFMQGMGADSRRPEVRFHAGYGSQFTQTRSTISRRVREPIHADQFEFTQAVGVRIHAV